MLYLCRREATAGCLLFSACHARCRGVFCRGREICSHGAEEDVRERFHGARHGWFVATSEVAWMATLLPVTHCLILPCAWRMSLLSYIYGGGGVRWWWLARELSARSKSRRLSYCFFPASGRVFSSCGLRQRCGVAGVVPVPTVSFFFVAVALVYLLFVKVRFTMHTFVVHNFLYCCTECKCAGHRCRFAEYEERELR